MNKKILLAFICVLIAALSVSTIYASDVSDIDSYVNSEDDGSNLEIAVDPSEDNNYESSVDNDASQDVLNIDSSTLSTNTDESNNLGEGESSYDGPTVTANNITKYYKGSTKYTATFLDLNGTPLANQDVNITVKGVSHTVKTNSNGVATLAIDLKPGTYNVVATNPVTGESLTTTFKILTTLSAKDMSKVYKDNHKFYAKFLNSNGKALAYKVVKFRVNGKTYKVKTNKNGVAGLSLKSLPRGTYKIVSYNNDGLTVTNTIKVYRSVKTSLTASNYNFLVKSSNKVIKVTLLHALGYAPGAGKIIKFKVNGKTYTARTNSKGVAQLKLPTLKEGTYTVKYSFAKTSYYYASSTSGKVFIIPSKTPTYTVKSTTTFGHGAGTKLIVSLTSGKVPLAKKEITINMNGVKYTRTTNSNGQFSIQINLPVGTYKVSYTNKAETNLYSKTGTCTINVIERTPCTFKWTTATTFNQGTQTCKIQVLDTNNKPVSGGTAILTVDSKNYTATTTSDGYATFKANYPVGNYSVSYSYGGDNLNAPSSGSTALTVKKINSISIKNLVTAANTVKNYYQNNRKLPTSVTAGGVTFTMPEFLYVLSQAIVQLGNSNTKDVPIITGVKAPTSPSGDTISSAQLTKANYIKVAQNVANYISNNNQAPAYASSAVGKIIYEELVDATARIVAFYGNNDNYLPNYVTISYGSSGGGGSVTGTGLNEKNTISDLAAYLKATTHCQVGNSKIKSLVNSLTSGLTTDHAKALAIYNYVRDKISYSFYYDTRHGAVGTLDAKSGNCVDQSHLLVAMFRTAGLPARYVHGTCTFSSGSTYGHVWTQVLIGNTWTVADPTSTRNSLGTIVNWNTKSFSLKTITREILF